MANAVVVVLIVIPSPTVYGIPLATPGFLIRVPRWPVDTHDGTGSPAITSDSLSLQGVTVNHPYEDRDANP